ncbi:4Fe-4S single cluster domain-containing protein [Xylanimonas allomyrinae]|uniref:4Fe-4S single cluster domain-containing protein n=1 Tax=Xylanimonas allomyrinae TaxID=2509459 RepID=UPI001FECE13B|nr:4Fe-4S single cluster domain-containing protein [Xylanimonas allomyrinae]
MAASWTTEPDRQAPAPGTVTVRIGHVVARTDAEGPGSRFAIWAQGCTIRCEGCFNPHLWGTVGGYAVTVDELMDEILVTAADGIIEGVTLLGGEPFDQASGFARLCAQVQAAGLSTVVFTGHTLGTLTGPEAPAGAAELLAVTDLLIDGPYLADRRDMTRPWVGSDNQEFHHLTDRYVHLKDTLGLLPDRVEVRVAANGAVAVNGWTDVDHLDQLLTGTTPTVGRGHIR